MKATRTAIIGIAALSLSACAADQSGYDMHNGRQVGGTLIGAAAGGLLGAQFGRGSGRLATTAAGTLAGAFIGASIGRNLDRRDRYYATQATEQALDYGRPGDSIVWNNPETGHRGEVRPGRVYATPQAPYCREYEQTITVGGRAERGYGQACRQPDGSWQIIG
ncbi:MAG: glycine zipper 2TM domain-containing protein [Alphaproteobacteria bacterium]|nr:glycine zipper 2TM domain-containing protein [Alphaproteobacteria bacterium]